MLLKRRKCKVFCLFIVLIMMAVFTGCASMKDDVEDTTEVAYKDVNFGHFKYSVPDYCEVKDTEDDMQLYGDKTVVADGYVIRSYCVSGVPVKLTEAVEMLYPEEELEYIEIGTDNTASYLLESVSEDIAGTPMYVYGYHFMSEDVLHVFGVWSYTEELSDEAQAIIKSIEKTYTTLADERQQAYEEYLERQHQQAMEEYYDNIEPSYEYEPEPYEPPAGAWR